jgi:hypothetical protein
MAGAALVAPTALAKTGARGVEQWGLAEFVFSGPESGNPYIDVQFSALFQNGSSSIRVPGFYDGEGVYKIRFCPPAAGTWRYVTASNEAALDGKSGSIAATKPGKQNHGLVRVANRYHFAYADGTPYKQFGTTSYQWLYQREESRRRTLQTLAASPFNKVRFTLFPNKKLPYEPLYPFVGAPGAFDLTRFNPAFFRNVDDGVARLCELGIEADIILFHPYDYDYWGFDKMPAEADDRYVRYVVARYSAYRNVWWSMANEYDAMKHKNDADIDRYFQIVEKDDPYGHLRSVHNMKEMYNNNHPWVTHASIQNGVSLEDDERITMLREVWRKPVVVDEAFYEGNSSERWGRLSGEGMTERFWWGMIAGVYVGHGEYIEHDGHESWIGTGGELRGTSAPRIGFLRQIVEGAPRDGVDPVDKWWDRHLAGKPGEYYLKYFGAERLSRWEFTLPGDLLKDGMRFKVDIIDTWAMTITEVPDTFAIVKKDKYDFADNAGKAVSLPSRPWMALRIRRVG